MHRPADFFVEQDALGGPLDVRVGANPEFTQKPRAGVGLQLGLQQLVTLVGLCCDDPHLL